MYDGRILNRAAEELRRRSDKHQRMQESRESEIENLIPRVLEIDIALRRSVIQVIHSALSGGGDAGESDSVRAN